LSEETVKISRALVVAAHPDDPEFGAGGTIAKWASDGIDVYIALTTNGNKGTPDPTMSGERLAAIRREEQLAAAAAAGALEVAFLDNNDCELENNLVLRGQIVRLIRRYRPDVVITHDPRPIVSRGRFLNHPDHRATGQATLDAIYPSARDPLHYPDHITEGLQPHKVLDIYLWGSTEPDTWVDISGSFEKKLAALRCHATQINNPEELEKRIRERAQQTAEGHEMELAEAFCRIQLPR